MTSHFVALLHAAHAHALIFGERRRFSLIASSRARAVWCNEMNMRFFRGLLVDYLSCFSMYVFLVGVSLLLLSSCVRLLRA